MQLHKSVISAFTHPSPWLGIGAIIATTASQLPDPYRTYGLLISGVFSIIGTILKPPTDEVCRDDAPPPRSQDRADD